MCCVIAALFAIGPRAAIVLWWLVDPGRWNLAFDTLFWPVLGLLLAPWTTLMWLLVFPGGIDGLDYLWLGIAVAFDLSTWFGGGYTNRDRLPTGQA